jgi:hypothetical protein
MSKDPCSKSFERGQHAFKAPTVAFCRFGRPVEGGRRLDGQQRGAKKGFGRLSTGQRRVPVVERFLRHVAVGDDHVLPLLLGGVKGKVGALKDVLATQVPQLPLGDADADEDLSVRRGDRSDGRPHTLADFDRGVLGRVGKDADELFAAIPGQEVDTPDGVAESDPHKPKNFVASGVSETVVVGLEVVNVQHRHRERFGLSGGPGRFFPQACLEGSLVR